MNVTKLNTGTVPRLTRRSAIVALGVMAVSGVIVSCSGGTTAATGASATAPAAAAPAAPDATATPAAQTVIVKMTDDFKFVPASVTINKGDTVEWDNSGAQPHTVTFDPAKAMDKSHVVLPAGVAPWDGGTIAGGASYKYTFTVSGEYDYICIPHEVMKMLGTVKVN